VLLNLKLYFTVSVSHPSHSMANSDLGCVKTQVDLPTKYKPLFMVAQICVKRNYVTTKWSRRNYCCFQRLLNWSNFPDFVQMRVDLPKQNFTKHVMAGLFTGQMLFLPLKRQCQSTNNKIN